MAFWNRKKSEETSEIKNLVNSGVLRDIEASIRKSAESRDRATEKQLKAYQDLTKALNSATREFQKGFKK
jgi:hypothetical protein